MMSNSHTLQSYLPLVTNFAERELKARYKRSLLGWLWSFINPVAIVTTYSLVFGVFLKVPPPETSDGKAEYFALYLFSGLVVWNLFTAVINGSMDWLAGVNDLRKKVFFPTETAILGGAVASGVQSALEAAVLMMIMAGFLNASWTFVLVPVVLLGAAMFGLGLGFVIAILNSKYRDVRYLVGILLNIGFYVAPIVYTLDVVPDRAYGMPIRSIIELNPVTQFVSASHDVVYFGQVPSGLRLLAIVLYAVVPFVVGLLFFQKRSMAISEEL